MLNKRLEELIITLGIKKGDFADKIGFTQAYISMVLNNSRQTPSDRFFESIKREFNVNIDWLKSGVGEMFIIDNKNLTPLELELVQKYNSLPLSERKIIDEIVEAMVIKQYVQNTQSKEQ